MGVPTDPGFTCLASAFYGCAGIDARITLQRLRRVAPSSRRRGIVAGESSRNHPQFVVRFARNADVGSKLPPTTGTASVWERAVVGASLLATLGYPNFIFSSRTCGSSTAQFFVSPNSKWAWIAPEIMSTN